MKKIRDVIVLALLAIPLGLFILCNHLILLLGDLLGISDAAARCRIKRRYTPAVRPFEPGDQAILEARRDALIAELERQGYTRDSSLASVVTMNGVFGLRMPHATARNSLTGAAKFIYYVEGTPFEMGRFIGLLAEGEVERMSVDYVNNVVFDYAGGKGTMGFWGNILADFLYRLARWNDAILPEDLAAELYGLWAGSAMAKRGTKVRLRDLYVLNYGVDVLLAYIYAGFGPILRFLGIRIDDFRPMMGCNAFSARGAAARGGHFFGRDFMFPTCDVYTDVAAHGIFHPVSDGTWHERSPGRASRHHRCSNSGDGEIPATILSFFAPGMAGSVMALSEHHVAMGLDMCAGRNTNWRKVGLNSLPMVRYAVSWAHDGHDLVDIVADAPRGITWLYPFADGKLGFGGVMETGMKTSSTNWLRYTPKTYRDLLPDAAFIEAHQIAPNRKGMFARLDSSPWNSEYLQFNQALYKALDRPWPADQWGERGILNSDPHGNDTPLAYYFAPQRESRDDLVLVGNHCIIPEMRLLAMNPWTCVVPEMGHSFDDFQWRYDRLNRRLLAYIDQGGLDFAAARDCANFLRPYETDGRPAEFHAYYAHKVEQVQIKRGRAPKGTYARDVVLGPGEIKVGGNICVVDMQTLRVESLWGMYADPWVAVDFGAILTIIKPAPKEEEHHD